MSRSFASEEAYYTDLRTVRQQIIKDDIEITVNAMNELIVYSSFLF